MNISKGVMKVDEWKGKSVLYKIACACMSDDCDCSVDFNFDNDFGDIEVDFYQNINWADYYNNNWFFTRWWARVKAALRVLWTGEMKLEGGFIIRGQGHIDSIIEAWQEGRDKMISWRKENDKMDIQ